MADDTTDALTDTEQQGGAQFLIRKLYLKDLSYESPNSPAVFGGQTNPDIGINLGASSSALGDDDHEVVVKVTVEAKSDDRNLFLVEVEQAGVFHLAGVHGEELAWALGVSCPNILFPYARQIISEMTVSGGFPPLLLNPVSFEALYRQHLAQQEQESTAQVTH